MSSSISSSDPSDRRWRTFAIVFIATAALLLAAALGLLAALDPYDTGRLALVRRPGVAEQGPRTADASRGRDPQFDSAIFGNSHVQLLRPENLKSATGLNFVSLAVPGTYPKEQLVLIDWFLRHHPSPAAMIVGLDTTWCLDSLNNEKPFPFWLYDPNPYVYLAGLMRYSALEHIPGRLALLLGKATPARRDGYRNYAEDFREFPGLLAKQRAAGRPTYSINPANLFPAADRLKAVLAMLSPSTRVVLAWPPTHIDAQPQPGSDGEATIRACHAAFAGLVSEHPGTEVVDWAVDRPETRADDNFDDQTHYRDNLAEVFQKDLAATLNTMRQTR
jgi:hypothetical protein